eukprot:9492355-Pyramimonas_sp.AAC.1
MASPGTPVEALVEAIQTRMLESQLVLPLQEERDRTRSPARRPQPRPVQEARAAIRNQGAMLTMTMSYGNDFCRTLSMTIDEIRSEMDGNSQNDCPNQSPLNPAAPPEARDLYNKMF